MVKHIECQAPSNIALIKYWGKKENQIPQNPSLSFTLSRSVTNTVMAWESDGSGQTNFLFEGNKQESFEKKIYAYRKIWEKDFPFIKNLNLKIESKNTFPHSAGIASSASSMASLSLCFTKLVWEIEKRDQNEEAFFQMASHYARLGSGSACRSLYPAVSTWGEWREGTSDLYASPVLDLPQSWTHWGDAILLVSSKEKPVSSRQGHDLMKDHPYSEARYSEAKKRLSDLYQAMKDENIQKFCDIVEREALELHGLMMNSNPSFILMKPESLAIIEKIRSYREKTALMFCFTLDAGPNIHLLYPLSKKKEVSEFIESELSEFLEDGRWIDDCIGQGPVL